MDGVISSTVQVANMPSKQNIIIIQNYKNLYFTSIVGGPILFLTAAIFVNCSQILSTCDNF